MEKINLLQIYNRDGITRYNGSANFLNGHKTCPLCRRSMIKTPIAQMFVHTKNGKILVDISQVNGQMLIHENTDVPWFWGCVNRDCPNAE